MKKELNDRLQIISSLGKNWDGYNAFEISNEVLENTKNTLQYLPHDKLNESSLSPNPHGTISIDFYNDSEELVSIEIGKTKIGFFAVFHDDLENPYSDGLEIEDSLLKELTNMVNRLYSKF